ncbi:hypothetical protein [Bradyrhizobium retamae]|uniref:hypothetical protein n=1 Tax=Bradyrhizobium retamae TaxID=1300035 RepID=UPI0012E3A93A|nr:hypothetical protein [Bradyrhizobium retamae]
MADSRLEGQKVSDRVLGSLVGVGAPTVDAVDGAVSRETVLLCQLWCRRDDGRLAVDAAVSDGPSRARS